MVDFLRSPWGLELVNAMVGAIFCMVKASEKKLCLGKLAIYFMFPLLCVKKDESDAVVIWS